MSAADIAEVSWVCACPTEDENGGRVAQLAAALLGAWEGIMDNICGTGGVASS